jgi:quercetin dioxygenase-like cupin family protein
MQSSSRSIRCALVLGSILAPACGTPRDHRRETAPANQARPAFAHPLPALDGARLEATLVEVSYPPGGGSAPHTHPCAVIGYVLSGALRSRVDHEPERIYHSGEGFYEAPNSRHQVSANASAEQPVRFLAYFTCDHRAPLSAPLTTGESGPGARP